MTAIELRKLDAWIAELVMGWDRQIPKPYRAGVNSFHFWMNGNDAVMLVQDWNPTTDPAAAMEVLKKCVQKGRSVMPSGAVFHTVLGITNFNNGYDVGYKGGGMTAEAETLELAICQFAKKLFSE